MKLLYADIAFPTPVRSPFTYAVPTELQSAVQVGIRVFVPLRNRFAIGVITKLHENKPSFKTLPIKSLLDHKPVLSTALFQLADWIHRYYFCSFGEAFQAMVPSGMNYQSIKMIRAMDSSFAEINQIQLSFLQHLKAHYQLPLSDALAAFKDFSGQDLIQLEESGLIEIWEEPKVKSKQATELTWVWCDSESKKKAKDFVESQPKFLKWHSAISSLLCSNLPATTTELDDLTCTSANLKRVELQGFIKREERVKSYSNSFYAFEPSNIRALNEEQFRAYDCIKPYITKAKHHVFLLKGITGSGKTEVYIHAIKTCLEMGKGAIVLVPEIALTPQTVRRFFEIFGDSIAVLHSRLTDSERLFAWNELQKGRKTIAIGPRSAVFAPIKDLGLIIVDEEHDNSYKQEDPAPRYNGRDAAIMRGFLEKVPVVLGSATPSLVSWHKVKEQKFELLELKSRHAGAFLPKVELVDLVKYKSAMRGPIAVSLFLAIQKALNQKEQIILLLNRRGYAPYLMCTDCGSIQECPNCSVSLTYHKPSKAYRCHYCGYGRFETSPCTSCHNPKLTMMGAGTQKIEEEIAELFPDARILRMDQDTTRGKHAHRDITEAFRKQEYDILIGTQLVSKGLDFPNVTVVGVINTDTELAFPSYKAHERMFQLLSQVAGRSGRGSKPGLVFFQSWKPDKIALEAAQKHDYELFAKSELLQREEVEYPPFSKIVELTFTGKKAEETGNAAQLFFDCTKIHVPNWPILGPAPSTINKIDREFYWDLVLKLHPEMKTHGIEELLNRIFKEYELKRSSNFSTIRITVRVDV